jgi:hypothetical protein
MGPDLLEYYQEDASHQGELWSPGEGATKKETNVPRLLSTPLVLFKQIWAEGCPLMPHEVLKLLMAHLESMNNNVVVVEWSLIAKCCLMVVRRDASGKSWVAFSVEGITEGEDKDLNRWLEQLLSSTLGARLPTGSTAGATGAHAQGLPNVLAQFATELSKVVAMGLMAWGQLANPTVLQGGVGDGEPKPGYSTKDIAALMGFACVHRGQDLPTIWDYFIKSKGKNIDNYHPHITTRMKQWAYDRRIEIDISIYLEQDTIKAIVDLKFNPV